MNTAYEEVVKSNKNLAMLHLISKVSGQGTVYEDVLKKTLQIMSPNRKKFYEVVNAYLSIYLHDMMVRDTEDVDNLEGYLNVPDEDGGNGLLDDFVVKADSGNLEQFCNRVIRRISWMKTRTGEEFKNWEPWNNRSFKDTFWCVNRAKGNRLPDAAYVILYIYEDLLRSIAGKESVNFFRLLENGGIKSDGMHIEHIMPRNIRDGDDSYVDRKDKDWWTWLDCLGNYSLITSTANEQAGNKPFDEKLAVYDAHRYCDFLQLKEVYDDNKDYGDWKEEQIELRDLKIRDMILEWDEALCPSDLWERLK